MGKDADVKASGDQQVGGHGNMVVEEAEVWKAVSDSGDGRGARELDFLRSIVDRSDLGTFKEFCPRFIKTAERDGQSYIVMSNLLQGFAEPALMDIKIGKQTWEDDATPEKKAKMIEKAKASTCWDLGFRLTGARCRSSKDGEWEKYGKAGGQKIADREGVERVFGRFFWHPKLQQRARERLAVLKAWFESQSEFSFIGSSLLFSYDTAVDEPELRLGLVDFQHVHSDRCANPAKRDLNCLMGLRILEDMLQLPPQSFCTGVPLPGIAIASIQEQMRHLDPPRTGKIKRDNMTTLIEKLCGWDSEKIERLVSYAAGISADEIDLEIFFRWLWKVETVN
eukprot:TRINITY_DN6860_c3_g1_i1.p1 TRINITY_DN6860_c3_g1~~TRINITY_DN6860_c3_g1_i1.p1  ORF type:complete len:356 (+),score=81.19 TRINITY_DN6860_c3_g1_i1:55-1068(+)